MNVKLCICHIGEQWNISLSQFHYFQIDLLHLIFSCLRNHEFPRGSKVKIKTIEIMVRGYFLCRNNRLYLLLSTRINDKSRWIITGYITIVIKGNRYTFASHTWNFIRQIFILQMCNPIFMRYMCFFLIILLGLGAVE